MPKIVSKFSATCEYCARPIPAGTEIQNEKSRSWHLACHEATTAAQKLVRSTVDALQGAGLEKEAEAIQESPGKASAVIAACDAADAALARAGGSGAGARDAVASYRATVPAVVLNAGATRAAAAQLISAEVDRLRKG